MNNQRAESRKISLLYSSLVLSIALIFSSTALSQTHYQSVSGVKIVIEGTSNIHDWDMKSGNGAGSAVFGFAADGTIASATVINFSMQAESLKSEHSAMDKNTYKALNTSKYPAISFAAPTATVRHTGGANYVLMAHGKLTIAGSTRDAELTVNCALNGDKTITCSGAYQLKMTDFKVTPPSIMFGAIKTGDGITVKFNFLLKSI